MDFCDKVTDRDASSVGPGETVGFEFYFQHHLNRYSLAFGDVPPGRRRVTTKMTFDPHAETEDELDGRMTDSSMHSKQLRFSSLVVFVRDISKSTRFYSELLNLEVVVETESAALLSGVDGNQLYLRGIGERASLSMGGLGPQYMVWSAANEAQFHACEAVMRRQSSHTLVTIEKEFMMAEGRDPDGAPVMVTYPGPDTVSRTDIIPRIFGW